jgi:hypothetical protein
VGRIRELMPGYGPMTGIWLDMGEPTPAESKPFAGAAHTVQPECMVSGMVSRHQGDFTGMGDNRAQEYVIDEPWQKREDLAGKTAEQIVKLVKVVSRDGNYLLNIGARGDASIVGFEADVLKGPGAWLRANGEAIHDAQAQPAEGRRRRPLEVRGGEIQMPETGPKTPPVAVIVAEYQGALEVTPPLAAPGRYRVSVELPVADASVEIDGQPASGIATLTRRGFHTLAITPKKPLVKGTRLSARPDSVIVTPEK